MRAEIVDDYDVLRPQCRHQELFDIEPEQFAVDRWGASERDVRLRGLRGQALTEAMRHTLDMLDMASLARRLVAQNQYDVIHDNQCLSYGTHQLQRMGLPLVTTIHHPITVDRKIAIRSVSVVFSITIFRSRSVSVKTSSNSAQRILFGGYLFSILTTTKYF